MSVELGTWERRLIERTLAEHGRKGDDIVVAAADRALFEKELAPLLAKHGLRMSGEPAAFQAGFVAVHPGSGIRLNCTLDKAFAEAVRSTEVEVGRTLFAS